MWLNIKSEIIGYTFGYIIFIIAFITVKFIEIAWIIFITTIIILYIINVPKYYKELKEKEKENV